jgi:Ca2+-binding RTX toxin-like protein
MAIGNTINGTAAADTFSKFRAPAGQPRTTDNDDTIYGFGGNDSFVGAGGNDIYYGGSGNDRFYIDDAGDVVIELANEGRDTVISKTVSLVLSANVEVGNLQGSLALDITGNDLDNNLNGNNGVNHIFGNEGNDSMNGEDGDDFLYGNDGADLLRGGNGLDLLVGGDGGDQLLGNDGDDSIYGEDGNDRINGGQGQDDMVGGTGADMFIFDENALVGYAPGLIGDVIYDFSQAEGDRISVGSIDAKIGVRGNQVFTFIGEAEFTGVAGQLRYIGYDNAETTGVPSLEIFGDVNGDAIADFEIYVIGINVLNTTDILL